MSRFREFTLPETAGARDRAGTPDRVLLIEDSVALSVLLVQRIEAETAATAVHCKTLGEAAGLLESGEGFTLAVTGLNLPDAPDGEVLDLLEKAGLPAIVFTAIFNAEARNRYIERNILDYIVKDGRQTVDAVIAAVARVISNRDFSVLVVDDAPSTLVPLAATLKRQNFNVFPAASGREALEILDAGHGIELVITDYHMPDMDGYELTRRIRQKHGSDEMRIIGISSSADRFLSVSFLKAGASDFVYKPFVPEEFQCRIDNNIETLRQLKRMRFLAEKDFLTGIYNRRYFFETCQKLIDADREARRMSAIAILDIDHFKKVNDTYGHDAGDSVLRHVAETLKGFAARNGHLVARLGGEEFVFLLRNAGNAEACAACEEMRALLAASPVTVNGTPIAITVSIGVAQAEEGEPFHNHLNAADQFLYMAKKSGRNRVFSELVLPEEIQRKAAVRS